MTSKEEFQSNNTLKLKPDIGLSFDDKTTNKILNLLPKLLQTEAQALNNAFSAQDWQETWFITEKLLSTVLYFDLPRLQAILKIAMNAAQEKILTQELMNKINIEIDVVLKMASTIQ